ncbi:DUF2630 family protein [Nocardia amamiensis]|uniref:DUF2630 family protein n=1 Tax=Nocardia amamiensis TaxID=404578 RepID=A0ABS0CZR1_9NOCA|nr:DUF2630 family protein [Nocardia amamiensis]MBF6301886.1 DUF2630 family protein [Nocardia amamiensis]
MSEQDILARIKKLVDQEHELRSQATRGELDPKTERQRLAELEVMLDQAWDLLRHRRARLGLGESADAVQPNSVSQVEGYLQ